MTCQRCLTEFVGDCYRVFCPGTLDMRPVCQACAVYAILSFPTLSVEPIVETEVVAFSGNESISFK